MALVVSCTNALAAKNPLWKLKEVSHNSTVVGYVYHSDAIGTQNVSNNPKVMTSIRFICSVDEMPPLISIFWDDSNDYRDAIVSVTIDNKLVNLGQTSKPWAVDGRLYYRALGESKILLNALKNGKVAKFQWTTGNTTRIAAFDISNMNLSEFNSKCKTSY